VFNAVISILAMAIGLFGIAAGYRSAREPFEITSTIRGMAFGTNGRLWLVTESGSLFTTPDAGAHWRDLSGAVPGKTSFVSFLDNSQGWALTGDGAFCRTLDGGENWTLLSRPGGGRRVVGALSIHFIDPAHGFLLTSFSIRRSEDGGTTWVFCGPPRNRGNAGESLSSCQFLDAKHGWVGGANGSLYRTTDGGKTWRELRVGAGSYSVGDISFVTESLGWVRGTPDDGHLPNDRWR
jgi:photosystem II stability/assembly factor-like uncharacterized protein